MPDKPDEKFIESEELRKPSSSVKITRNSTSKNIEVKLYACDSEEDIDRVTKKAMEVFDEILKKYKVD